MNKIPHSSCFLTLFGRHRKALDDIISGEYAQFSGLAQVTYSLPVISPKDMYQSAIIISVGKMVVQFDSFIVISQRRMIIFHHRQNVAPIIISIYKIRLQLDDFIQVFTNPGIINRAYCGNFSSTLSSSNFRSRLRNSSCL